MPVSNIGIPVGAVGCRAFFFACKIEIAGGTARAFTGAEIGIAWIAARRACAFFFTGEICIAGFTMRAFPFAKIGVAASAFSIGTLFFGG